MRINNFSGADMPVGRFMVNKTATTTTTTIFLINQLMWYFFCLFNAQVLSTKGWEARLLDYGIYGEMQNLDIQY